MHWGKTTTENHDTIIFFHKYTFLLTVNSCWFSNETVPLKHHLTVVIQSFSKCNPTTILNDLTSLCVFFPLLIRHCLLPVLWKIWLQIKSFHHVLVLDTHLAHVIPRELNYCWMPIGKWWYHRLGYDSGIELNMNIFAFYHINCGSNLVKSMNPMWQLCVCLA